MKFNFNCFNSLQTGKPIQRNGRSMKSGVQERQFQFPSNGKAYPKQQRWWQQRWWRRRFNSLQTGKPIQRKSNEKYLHFKREYFVSIPFKRESLSKVTNGTLYGYAELVFQFPSNGKAYPKHLTMTELDFRLFLNEFQFPSNGKAYPK